MILINKLKVMCDNIMYEYIKYKYKIMCVFFFFNIYCLVIYE